MPAMMVDVPTADGVADSYLSQPDDQPGHPAVLFFPDAIGLRPRVYEMADRIASHGYVVLLPNVFYRSGRVPLIEGLEALLKAGDRAAIMEAVRPIASKLDPADAMRDTQYYLDYLASLPTVQTGPVGLTGYCMGAGLSLRTAGTYPDRVAAAAGFHGGNLATDAPNSPHLLAPAVTAELYFGHADNDASMPPEQAQRLAEALTDAGITFRAEVYEGAIHGYTMSDTAAYGAQHEERHWRELLGLFNRVLLVPA